MSEVKLPFSKDFQQSILNLMVVDDYFCSKAIQYLQEDYFENIYLSWVFNVVKQYYKKWRMCPTSVYLKEEIRKVILEEQFKYKAILTAIIDADVKNVEYVKTQLTAFIRLNRFKNAHATSANMFNNSEYEDAYRYTQDQIHEIRLIDFNKDDVIEINEVHTLLEKTRDINKSKITTGIPVIDIYLEGGIPKQSVTTIMGGYNSYKSSFLINCAYHAARKGTRVLFIFHEGRREQILARFLSRLTLIPYNKIISSPLTLEENAQVEAAKQFIEGRIVIKPMRNVGVSVEDVYEYGKSVV